MLIRVLLSMAIALSACVPPASAEELLDPARAFVFSAQVRDPHTVEVDYRIAPGYYLYRSKLAFAIAGTGNGAPVAVVIGAPRLPPGSFKTDKIYGRSEIYRDNLSIELPVTAAPGTRFILTASSQGCADIGVCYAPQTHKAELVLAAFSAGSSAGDSNASPFLRPAPAVAQLPASEGAEPGVAGAGEAQQAEDTRIAALFRGGFWVLIAKFFVFGLLLAFTPCVFPMIPILSGILVPHGEHLTRMRGFLLSLAYVLGMALTYAVAGVAAGLAGSMLSAALQNPWVLGGFALVFVVLSLSMFGFYELQLPSSLQSRLTSESNKLHGGHFAGVFTMGILSALIVGPCVAAPLAGALLYVSQSRDVILGGSALFVMALGMGVPLLAVGISGGTLLPKSGPWMESIKQGFGVILLGLAIYMISPVIPAAAHMLLWAALLIVSAICLRALDALPPAASGYRKVWKGIGVMALLAGAALFIGALSGGRDILHPLAGLRLASTTPGGAAVDAAPFRRIASRAELDAALADARGRIVMLDFYADWCVSCKEMERDTFSDPRVRARLERAVLLQADVTDNLPEHQALLKRFGLYGPPGILFFSAGQEVRALRVIGFQPADTFAATLDRLPR